MAHIVILEDDTALAGQIREMLQQEHHTVVTFDGVHLALEYFKSHKIDLVIADIFIKSGNRILPEGGVTLISRIRQVMGSRVPIIAISGSFAPGNHQTFEGMSKTVGATATLAKPFHPDKLVDLVASLLLKA